MNHQLSLFDTPQVINKEQLLLDLFTAYYHARKNKRNTINQLEFEIDYESNLLELYENIIAYNYAPKRSICFIINKPIKREIFATDFSDRVVHHLIYNYIYPIFDKSFIPDSYSCRKGKGTHYGIKRIDKFIRECSHNYATDCYILKQCIIKHKDYSRLRHFCSFNKLRQNCVLTVWFIVLNLCQNTVLAMCKLDKVVFQTPYVSYATVVHQFGRRDCN